MESFSVAALLGLVDAALRSSFPDEVWVEGEIGSLKSVPLDPRDPRLGRHIFFNLLDPDTVGLPGSGRPVLPVKLFDTQRQRVNAYLKRYGSIKMSDGVRVRIRGQLQFYASRSQVELRMSLIDPAYTLALLASERDLLLRLLREQGLLEKNRSLSMPLVPLRVGVVTSAGSAAAADFLSELQAANYGWSVTLAHTRVQGAGADGSIATAIDLLAGRAVDVIAIVRGGGARTELATFDAEAVARAIARCPIPVVTGIGHEVDESVADRVAHASYKTPTACAAALAARVRSYLDGVERTAADVRHAALTASRRASQRVERAAGSVEARTHLQLAHARNGLTAANDDIVSSTRRAIATRTQTLAHLDARVRAHDPVRTLARGWSITRRPDGSLVRSANELRAGDRIVTTFADGDRVSRIEGERDAAAPADDTTTHRRGAGER